MNSNNDGQGDHDKFEPENYPHVVAEVSGLVKMIRNTSIYFRTDIILSYLRDRSIRTEWIEANPAIASLMIQETQPVSNVEKLLASCRWNKTFRNDLERYIRKELN
jgi:hypothetical protein